MVAIFSRLSALFKRSLKNRPVITNTLVYFTFYSAAEMSQQTFNKYHASEDRPDYNFVSAARVACTGSLVYAPALYFWYRLLDRKFPGTKTKTVAIKVLTDQYTMTPLLLAVFFTVLGVLEGNPDIFSELKAKYWTAFTANQIFWLPCQTVNFYLIPPTLRVVYVASVSFVWINILCFIKRLKIETSQ